MTIFCRARASSRGAASVDWREFRDYFYHSMKAWPIFFMRGYTAARGKTYNTHIHTLMMDEPATKRPRRRFAMLLFQRAFLSRRRFLAVCVFFYFATAIPSDGASIGRRRYRAFYFIFTSGDN